MTLFFLPFPGSPHLFTFSQKWYDVTVVPVGSDKTLLLRGAPRWEVRVHPHGGKTTAMMGPTGNINFTRTAVRYRYGSYRVTHHRQYLQMVKWYLSIRREFLELLSNFKSEVTILSASLCKFGPNPPRFLAKLYIVHWQTSEKAGRGTMNSCF